MGMVILMGMDGNGHALKIGNGHGIMATDFRTELPGPMRGLGAKVAVPAPRLRHDLQSFVVGRQSVGL